MYYPPDIKNLRNSESEEYVSLKDFVESHTVESEAIPLLFGADDGGYATVDVMEKSPVFICGNGHAHTGLLWNFIAITALYKSPESAQLVLIDPLGVDLNVAECLPHVRVPVAKTAPEILGALKCVEDEMKAREAGAVEYSPLIVVASRFDRAYAQCQCLYKERLEALFERGRAVGIYFVITTSMDKCDFCDDFVNEAQPLPKKPLRESYERDIIGLFEEAAYRNRKTEDKTFVEKFNLSVAEAKQLFDEYQRKRKEQDACILKNFFDALEILSEHKKISTAIIQAKLRIGYGTAAKIIDSLLALSIIRKSEDGARYYSINIDDKQLSEIINGYVGKKR